MKSPLEKIIARATECVADELRMYHDATELGLESPIEQIFFAALYATIMYDNGLHDFRRIQVRGDDDTPLLDGEVCVHVSCQHKFKAYRLDFVITVWSPIEGTWRSLVVECDGHEFHERTKEQAERDRARDRAIQEYGSPVYRFTGSELYRDPMKCAAQVMTWARKTTFP